MKSPGRKKKIVKQNPTDTVDLSVIKPPTNLLPEHTESKEETPVVNGIKEASSVEVIPDSSQEKLDDKTSEPEVKEKTVSEQKEALPMIDVKIDEVKTDDVVPGSELNLPLPAPPPIPVPVSQIDVSASSSQPPDNRKFLLGGLAILLVLILAGSWFYFSNNSKKVAKKIQADNSAKPTVVKIEPTTVTNQEVKPNKYPIKVLNGSGITGEASKLQEILEKEGFKVSETGNADNYEYTDTIVQTKKDIEKTFLEKLKNLIGKTYSVGTDDLLSASGSSDIVVIVGSKKID